MRYRIFTAIFSVLLSGLCYSQEFAYKLYTPQDDGLVQTQVNRVREAPDGSIWAATYGGVSCFDGTEFRNFTEHDGLSSDIVYDLTFYRDTVFVLTRDGIDLIVKDKVYPYFRDNKVQLLFGKIFVNDKYRITLVFNANGDKAYFYDIKNHKNFYLLPDSLKINMANMCFTDSSIMFCRVNKLYEIPFASKKIKLLLTFPGWGTFITCYENAIYIASGSLKNNNIQVQHILKINRSREFHLKSSFTIQKDYKLKRGINPAYFIPLDCNRLLLFSNDGYITLWNNSSSQRFAMNFNNINGGITDRNSLVWVATEKGLLKIFTHGFQYYTPSQGIPENVWSVISGKDGSVMFASYNHGFCFLRNGIPKKIKTPGNLINFFNGACKGFHGEYIFGTATGLALFNPETQNLKPVTDKLRFASLTLFRDEKNRRILIGNMRTLISMDENYRTDTIFRVSELGSLSTILSIAKKDETIFLGLARGLVEFNPRTRYARFIGDQKIRFNSLDVDSRNSLWAATSKGLINIMNGRTTLIPGIKDNEEMIALIESNDQRLFVAGLKTLYILDLDKYYANRQDYLTSYCVSNGYYGGEAQQNSFTKDDEGNLWLPTSLNVVKIIPSELSGHFDRCGTHIIGITNSMNNTFFFLKDFPSSFYFPYSQNNIRISYEAIYQPDPLRLSYSYVLSSEGRRWESVLSQKSVSFNNLQAGKYVFRIKAITGNRPENNPESSFSFVVGSPFWNTWWFYCILAIGSIILLVFMLLLIQQQVRIYTQKKMELSRLKGIALSTQIDQHFLASCNARINALYELGLTEEAYNYSTQFSNFLKHNLLMLRKEKITLEEELQLVQQYVQLEKFHRNEFSFRIENETLLNPKKIFIPHFMLQPLIENAIKHGISNKKGNGGKILLQINKNKDLLIINIEDNGEGYHPEKPSNFSGYGVSIKILRERLELMGKKSKLEIENIPGKTRVTLVINIGSI